MSTAAWTGRPDGITQADSERRLRELVLYVAMRSEGDPAFAKTKLNKILYFSDFAAFKQWGESITGQEYRKRDQGPCPSRMVPVLKGLESDRALTVRPTPYHGKVQEKPIALKLPTRGWSFTRPELALVDELITLWWGINARDISDASHDHLWNNAGDGERIPYGAVLFTNKRPLTAEIRSHARRLQPMAAAVMSRRARA